MQVNNSNATETPQSLIEAVRYFEDEDVCLQFMVGLRWPDGVVCPRCNSDKVGFVKTRRIWNCKGCKQQFSAKVGTIMEDSPIKLSKWMPAFWLIANTKNGTSSCELARHLKVRQATAWFMLHRIRVAMQEGTIVKMSGQVEADETFIGGKAANMHKAEREKKIVGRGATGKEIVMGLLDRGERFTAEEKKRKIGKHSKVRVKHVKDTTAKTLQGEVRANVEPGSILYTDAAHGYQGLGKDYIHGFIDHAITYVDGTISTNGLENFWCLLKRSIRGTYVHVNSEHLTRYLDEQAFRFNERGGTDAERFREVLRSIQGRRLTYKQLIAKRSI